MSLISLQFVVFVAVFLCIYYLVGHFAPNHQWRVILPGSIVFYTMAYKWQGLVFIIAVAVASFTAARVMHRIDDQAKAQRKATKDRKERKQIKAVATTHKRRVLFVGLAVLLVILGYPKYWNVILYNVGLEPSTTSLGILLPLGISFYTFQSIMYVIDVYNNKYAAETDFVRYLTFVSYFPQLVQGPINRYDEISPQLFAQHHFDRRRVMSGLVLLWYGAFKKIAIANVLVGNVNTIFGNVTTGIPGSIVVFGAILYSLQEYADFSGGIDIVRGTAEMMGIQMSQNFNQPYFSTSLADFWRRWHMSLGVFMKDYVFYPIALTKPFQNLGKWGQKRLGKHLGRTIPACLANIVVFLVVGFWHGAEWHFLLWGLANGLVIAAADLLAPVFTRVNEALHIKTESAPWRIWQIVRTFLLVCLIRYFDVIVSPADAFICLKNTFTNFMPLPYRECLELMGIMGVGQYGLSRIAILGYVLMFVVSFYRERGVDVRGRIVDSHGIVWTIAKIALVLVMAALMFASLRYSLGAGGDFAYAGF